MDNSGTRKIVNGVGNAIAKTAKVSGYVIEVGGDILGVIAGKTVTFIVVREDVGEVVCKAIQDTLKDIGDVVSGNFTDKGDNSKGPIPKLVRILLPGGTVASKSIGYVLSKVSEDKTVMY